LIILKIRKIKIITLHHILFNVTFLLRRGNIMKKKVLVLSLLVLGMVTSSTVYAAKITNGPRWVQNTENWHQLSYFGEAYTIKGYGTAQITYYRNNIYVGGAYAHVDPWRTDKNSDYQTVTIWDSLNPISPKTKWYYSL